MVADTLFILQKRKENSIHDTSELQAKRKEFLEMLTTQNYAPCEINSIKPRYGGRKDMNYFVTRAPVMVGEMYSTKNQVPVKSRFRVFQDFDMNDNCRIKMQSETCFEIDSLDLDKAISVICEVCLALMRQRIHFYVWFCESGRSPHIRIYDFDELTELEPYQREKAQAQFWRSVAPWAIQHADKAMWQDEHPYCLEYAPHWKHGHIFNLLFEYNPEEQCNT